MPTTNARSPLVADFAVSVNGAPLPSDVALHVVAVAVDDSVDWPSMFAIELAASEHADRVAQWIDGTQFAIGHAVDIQLGYVDNLASVIKGEITALEVEFTSARLPRLTVRGFDRRHRLQRGRKVRTFVQQKDSDIASQIASEAGLTAQAEDSSVVHDYLLQSGITDFDLLRQRAHALAYELGIDDRTLIFRPLANAAGETLTLALADELLAFLPRLSSAGQVSEVAVRGWNVKDKQAIVGQAAAGAEVSTMGGRQSAAALADSAFGAAVGLLSRQPVATQSEADQLAAASFNRGILELIEGEGTCWGRTDLRAGTVIRLDGVGTKLSGAYYVVSAEHRYTAHDGYRTRFVVRRNAT